MKYTDLDTPSLLIDYDILKSNLEYMQAYADKNHVNLRPHTKTHKMPFIASLQTGLGACGIAVAKTGEAEVMASCGLTDIFIANEIVGRTKLNRICSLTKKAAVSFGVDSPCQVLEAEQVFGESDSIARVLIEIEVGENRSGVVGEEDFLALLETMKKCPHVRFLGIFSHDGNCYGAKDLEECRKISEDAQRRTLAFASLAKEFGMECEIVSYGSTPPFMIDGPILPGITEIRPGTYALMDAAQAHVIGTLNRCAATVFASVISRPTKERVILDVGAKGLTMQERTKGICSTVGKGTVLEYPDTHIHSVFDEHAILYDSQFRESVQIGQKVRIIPVHICPVCNLYNNAFLISGEEVVEELPVLCRGRLT